MEGCSVVAADGVGLPLGSCEISVFAVHVVAGGVQLASRKKIWPLKLLVNPATLDELLKYAKYRAFALIEYAFMPELRGFPLSSSEIKLVLLAATFRR